LLRRQWLSESEGRAQMRAKPLTMDSGILISLVIGLLLIGLLLLPGSLQAGNADVVINEVLANAADEDTGEFVELYNTGTTPVNVQDWRLYDPDDTNDTITDYTGTNDWGSTGTSIPAGGYAIVVDPQYAGESNTYLDSNADPSKVVMLTIAEDVTLGNNLANKGDTVTIDDNSGYTASFTWTTDAGDSTSWEKKNPTGGDSSSNWGVCTDPNGSTPGVQNSIYDPTAITLSSFTAHPIASQGSFFHWQWAVGLVLGGGAVARRLLICER
jgi:hypothetical protein